MAQVKAICPIFQQADISGCVLTFVFPLLCSIEYEFIHPDHRVPKGCFMCDGPSSC